MDDASTKPRAPDPTLTAHDDDVAVVLLDPLPVAHRIGSELAPGHPCRNVHWSPTPHIPSMTAAYIAVPCRECFPDAPPLGCDFPHEPIEGIGVSEPIELPDLAWQVTAT